MYTDNSKEFAAALQRMCVCHDTCTLATPAANGIAERAVRRVKEGTSGALAQCGLSDLRWHRAMATFCFLRNMHDVRADGKTAYKVTFGEHFSDPIIPLGAGIEYKPSRQKDIDNMPKIK